MLSTAYIRCSHFLFVFKSSLMLSVSEISGKNHQDFKVDPFALFTENVVSTTQSL